MQNWHIRRAKDGDAEALIRCIDAAYAPYQERLEDLPPVSEGISQDIRTHCVWVAELHGSVVGGLVLILREEFALLANIAVDPSASGLGLGRGLIECAEAESRRLGLREMRLSTHVGMPENVHLYEHLGWRESGRSGSKVHMVKRL